MKDCNIVVTYTDKYEFECAYVGTKLNGSIEHALREIRARLKHGENLTEQEDEILVNIRNILGEYYVEG